MFGFLEQEDIYHLIINRTATALARAITLDFKERNIPINKEQFSVLIILWKKDGCAQQVLSEYTNRDKPGVTRLIDTMEREGLVIVNKTLLTVVRIKFILQKKEIASRKRLLRL